MLLETRRGPSLLGNYLSFGRRLQVLPMNQPRWQRQLVGVAAMLVGIVLCGLGALVVLDTWLNRHWRLRAIDTEDLVMVGVCLTLGLE